MATYFGEIIEPKSRSFVTDGEESVIDERYFIETENEGKDQTGLTYDYLIIACGKILEGFTGAYIICDSIKVIEKYNIVPRSNENEKLSRNKITSTLYQLSKNTLLFVCERLPHLYFAHSVLVKLKPWIETASHTIVLTSENMINFKPKVAIRPFLRSLHTSTCTLTLQAPNLELPNTISGLPAAVISWCQANKKSALVYVVYVESTHLDSITAEPLLELIKASNFLNFIISSNTNKLKTIVHNAQLQHSNLYL